MSVALRPSRNTAPLGHVSRDQLRLRFARALSAMYRAEVPPYGVLTQLVEDVNAHALERDPALKARLAATDGLQRISEERHGAIRLGTGDELRGICRLFAAFGMEPVGYYDLGPAGVPVHSTAFRPVEANALAQSPFRVFTSLLRTEAIEDTALRREAERLLRSRNIFYADTLALADRAVEENGLSEEDATDLIAGAIETFRFRPQARASRALYEALKAEHPLIADVVAFKGPHINHLTPRTLAIDEVQRAMPERGIVPKAVVEGPPPRRVSILLRQTSFKALTEPVSFAGDGPEGKAGAHTARFGEVEERGVALTPKGRALYDRLLDTVRARVTPQPGGSNRSEYEQALRDEFTAFPDDEATMRREGLAYFRYQRTDAPDADTNGLLENADEASRARIERLIERGAVRASPIVYEDFLPVSAAGIFQSNLGDRLGRSGEGASRDAFEDALDATVRDEFAVYGDEERASIARCLAA